MIFYPTTFTINPPTPSTLGGVFSNAGGPHLWVSSINLNGSVTLTQPSFSDISGTLAADQLPSPLEFSSITATGLITAEAGVEIGVVGTTSGQLTLDGSTSGQALITAPAVAGTSTNPLVFTNGIQVPSAAFYSLGGDTGISRASAAVLDVGNGSAGDASGTVNAAQYNIAGSQIAAANLSNGVTGTGAVILASGATFTGNPTFASQTGTGAVVRAASPTVTGTLGAAAITASGIIQGASFTIGASGPTITAGAGVPSGSAPNGSLYINTTGTHSGTTLFYIYDAATTWVPLA